MFADELDVSPSWEMSDEEWEAQLADLIRRDPASHDEIDDALLDAARHADDDPWLERPLTDAGVDPAALSDAAIIDTITAVQRHLDWAGARQARLLAEFTTRRPTPTHHEQPGSAGGHPTRSPSPCPRRTRPPGRRPGPTPRRRADRGAAAARIPNRPPRPMIAVFGTGATILTPWYRRR